MNATIFLSSLFLLLLELFIAEFLYIKKLFIIFFPKSFYQIKLFQHVIAVTYSEKQISFYLVVFVVDEIFGIKGK